ncbi:PEPxxWA-CTERM sorting domain-containing protein [Phenylobacterium sp.]|uniref:PEPxxWA-CTERM sorting domain-containing protein n=1 Tax=Phenylobacterium sp. TaxID=1871053 RepID=UPI002F3F316B
MALLMGFGAAGQAQASDPPVLGAYTTSVECDAGNVTGVSACSAVGSAASVKTTPFVLLSATASAGEGNFADATADYDFLVSGGTAGDVVTVGFTTLMETDLTGGGSSHAQVVWFDSVKSSGFSICSSPLPEATACAHGGGIFSGTIDFSAVSGEVGHIHLDVDAGTGFGGSGTASLDPFMFVENDPNGIYSLQLSDGVPNAVGGVPEASTWALMLVGFGLAGASLRRRRAGLPATS